MNTAHIMQCISFMRRSEQATDRRRQAMKVTVWITINARDGTGAASSPPRVTLLQGRVYKYSARRSSCAFTSSRTCSGALESDTPLPGTSSCGMTTWVSGPWWRGWHARVTSHGSSHPHKTRGLCTRRSAPGALMPPRALPVRQEAPVSGRPQCAASVSRTERARRSTRATG